MSRAQDTAYRLRWLILVMGLLLLCGGLLWMLFPSLCERVFGVGSAGAIGTPLQFVDIAESSMWINTAMILGALLILQWMFLRPRRGWMIQLTQTGRPLRTSVIVAGCMAMLLTTAVIATLLEIPNEWAGDNKNNTTGVLGTMGRGIWAVMAGMWVVWSLIFWIYWRQGDRYTQLGRMTRGLIAGSCLELCVAVPVHAAVYKRDDCYCARGSYTGLVLGCTVLAWAFGPGIILLFLREKYRRAKLLETRCVKCGYDLRGTLAAGRTSCPECGAAIAAPT